MSSTGLAEYSGAARAKLDVYLLAALHSGFAHYELGATTRAAALVPIGFTVQPSDNCPPATIRRELMRWFQDGGRLATAHLDGLNAYDPAYLTGDASPATLRRLADAAFVTEIQLCAALRPLRDLPARLTAGRSSPEARVAQTRTKKILATIDHGCPFAHEALRDAKGRTRVHAIWDQDARPDFPAVGNSTPAGYRYGRQVQRAMLDAYMRAATSNGCVDEEKCYRSAHYSAVRTAVTHGSCVVSLIGSRWMSPRPTLRGMHFEREDEASEAALVFVQLPRVVATAPSRGSIDRAALDGVRYVLDCAPDGADVAVVMDYGTEMGPHDGSSWFERALDSLILEADRQRGISLHVVFASGNSYDRRRHATLFHRTRASAREAAVQWCVPPGSDALGFAEMWFYEASTPGRLDVTLPTSPKSSIRVRLDRDGVYQWPPQGPAACIVVSQRVQRQRVVMIQLAPTRRSLAAGASAPLAPSGAWSLKVTRPPGQTGCPVHLYTCWGGHNPGLVQRLVASHFEVRSRAATARVSGEGSLLGSGCGKTSFMAGGYQGWGCLAPAPYSGAGAARGGRRAQVDPLTRQVGADWLARTEDAPSLPGLLLNGTRSAAWVRAWGTSFASPQAARALIAGNPKTIPAPPQWPPPGTVLKRRRDYHEPRIV